MKFQKVIAVLGLSTCLAASPVLVAVAQEQPQIQQESVSVSETAEQDTAEELVQSAEQTSQPAPAQEAEPAVSDSSAAESIPDSAPPARMPDEEQSAAENGPEETGEAAEEETTEETGEAAEEETTEETGEAAEEETTEETGEAAEEETTEETGEAAEEETEVETGEAAEEENAEETGGSAGEKPAGETDQSADKEDAAEMKEADGSNQKEAVRDSVKPAQVLDAGNYPASEKFLDNRDKIKYNVDLPLENIPSFITQEMIIGALKCQDETGYPASVTIAQIIQESGYGKYGPGGEDGKGLSYLAYQYNNLFGIKGIGPAGTVNMRTGEQTADGTSYSINAGFRVYNTYTECIEDRADLLKRVYSDLTEGVEDANTFAMRIGGRWATDVDYGLSLIRVMQRYDLYRLDEMTVGEFSDMLGTFVNPCPGAVLTSDFGYRTAPTAGASTYHKGIDLGTGKYNIPTYAAAEGTVIFAGEAGSAGIMVVIDHGDGLVTRYMHHDRIYVEEGDEVEKGQQIGLSGTTGISTGNHLHFQIEQDGHAVDPMEYLDLEENQ